MDNASTPQFSQGGDGIAQNEGLSDQKFLEIKSDLLISRYKTTADPLIRIRILEELKEVNQRITELTRDEHDAS